MDINESDFKFESLAWSDNDLMFQEIYELWEKVIVLSLISLKSADITQQIISSE